MLKDFRLHLIRNFEIFGKKILVIVTTTLVLSVHNGGGSGVCSIGMEILTPYNSVSQTRDRMSCVKGPRVLYIILSGM